MHFTAHRVLKGEVSFVEKFVTDMPVAGPHFDLYCLLTEIFLQTQNVFAGSISEVIEAAKGIDPPLSEQRVKEGFSRLEEYGYINFAGDVFIPSERFLQHFY